MAAPLDLPFAHAALAALHQGLDRSAHVAGRGAGLLVRRLTGDGFSAGWHLWAAQRFALRGTFPAMGRPVPELGEDHDDAAWLADHAAGIRALLPDAATLSGAARPTVTHEAGEATLTQLVPDYLATFVLPNLHFHLTTGYAILRLHGAPLGKADYDGLHRYAGGPT
ncbi:MAG: DUF1993 family protein [Shimia sp.]